MYYWRISHSVWPCHCCQMKKNINLKSIYFLFFFFQIDFYDWLVRWTSVRLLITEVNGHEKKLTFWNKALFFSLSHHWIHHNSFRFFTQIVLKFVFCRYFRLQELCHLFRARSHTHIHTNHLSHEYSVVRILFSVSSHNMLDFIFPSNFIPITHTLHNTHRLKRLKVLLWSWQLCAPKFRNPSAAYILVRFVPTNKRQRRIDHLIFGSSYRWLIRMCVDLFH